MKNIIDLIGRILLSFIFLFEAYDSIAHFAKTKAIMASYGITWQPDFLLSGAIFLLVVGGILLLLGYRTTFGASLLLIYWIPATFIVHSFWNDPPELVRAESQIFMKNLAIMGGLLLVLVNDSGKYSVRRIFSTTKV